MTTAYEQMISNVTTPDGENALEFGKEPEFNPADASEAEFQEEIDRLTALKNHQDSAEEEDSLDRIQAEAEAIEEDEDAAKAAKQAKLKKARLVAAHKRFMKKVVHKYTEELPAHIRTYYKRPAEAGIKGEEIMIDVPDQTVIVYVGAPGAKLPEITAQGMQSRGGKKRISDDCDEPSDTTDNTKDSD